MKPLTLDSISSAIRNVDCAITGEVAIRSEDYMVKLQKVGHGLPFDKVISSNVGNPQQKGLDQPPITFTRQVAALMEYPELMELAPDVFPKDVIERAKELHAETGAIGAYSHSQGVPFIRKNVAKFIEERDGYPSNPDHIFLTGGASEGIDLLIQMLITSPKSGILIPIPQYPLYGAALTQHSVLPIPYYLDEPSGWSTSISSIEAAIAKAKNEGIEPKALVVINPGNPTGAVLDEPTQENLVKLCEEHSLVLLADEVYQVNLHKPHIHPFTSFKRVVSKMSSPLPLVSFHSISKGISGECGRRGGYFELANFSSELVAIFYKMVSFAICPPVQGQIGVDCMVRYPKPGSESYDLWKKETDMIHAALAHRMSFMVSRLNNLPGVSCVDSLGALYLYPNIRLPPKAVEEAKKKGQEVDTMYALQLLDETGVCVVPGSGFELEQNSEKKEWHYRLTCLCPDVDEYLVKLEGFHRGFMQRYDD